MVAASAKYGGILTAGDLAGYKPEWRQPLRYQAFGWELASADLPASGGILLAASTRLLDRSRLRQEPALTAPTAAHLLAEVWRRVYADRFLLGDPTTTLRQGFRPARSKMAGRPARRHPARPGHPLGRGADVEPGHHRRRARNGTTGGAAASGDTTHISVVDGDGMAVALTTTLNGLYGCGLWVPEAGYFLNNEMDDFATAPGKPNLFGLIQGDANAVGPGKRMLSSQSPTLRLAARRRRGDRPRRPRRLAHPHRRAADPAGLPARPRQPAGRGRKAAPPPPVEARPPLPRARRAGARRPKPLWSRSATSSKRSPAAAQAHAVRYLRQGNEPSPKPPPPDSRGGGEQRHRLPRP